MIPRVAYFYWTGGELPWLRRQALISFQRLHPGWDVVLGSPEDREVPAGVRLVRDQLTDPQLPPAARSDVWRWHALAQGGGLYADTDVIFIKPVDRLFRAKNEAWLTTDLGTPVPNFGWEWNRQTRKRTPRVAVSIGVMAAAERSVFFARVLDHARNTPPSPDYQSHGTRLLVANWKTLQQGCRIGPIPADAFYRDGSSARHVRELWSPTGDLRFFPEEYGVHWYGGSTESDPYRMVQSTEELPDCLVRRALETTLVHF